jgi:hypothetical protein
LIYYVKKGLGALWSQNWRLERLGFEAVELGVFDERVRRHCPVTSGQKIIRLAQSQRPDCGLGSVVADRQVLRAGSV